MSEINFKKLAEPFASEDIEWRLQSCGETNSKIWGKCLAYITNRAIQQRLDDVVGPENWKNEYITGPNGGILCGISIRCNGEWITKWDGAENTQVEAVKGGLSDSMKRAAVQWSMGRYLYKLDEGWAEVTDKGKFSGKTKEGKWFKWNPPKLPSWALPSGSKESKKEEVKSDTTPMSDEAEKLRKQEIKDSEEYKSLEADFNKYIGMNFLSEKSISKIKAALEECDIKYLREVKEWCENQLKKAS